LDHDTTLQRPTEWSSQTRRPAPQYFFNSLLTPPSTAMPAMVKIVPTTVKTASAVEIREVKV
jgi:hypothetical protein